MLHHNTTQPLEGNQCQSVNVMPCYAGIGPAVTVVDNSVDLATVLLAVAAVLANIVSTSCLVYVCKRRKQHSTGSKTPPNTSTPPTEQSSDSGGLSRKHVPTAV